MKFNSYKLAGFLIFMIPVVLAAISRLMGVEDPAAYMTLLALNLGMLPMGFLVIVAAEEIERIKARKEIYVQLRSDMEGF